MAELPSASEEIVSTFIELAADQRTAYLADIGGLTDIELAEIVSRGKPYDLETWERATRKVFETGGAGADTAALIHGLVVRIARGDDPQVAIRELAEAIPGFYENEGND